MEGVGRELQAHVAAERRETENPPPDLGGYARWPRRLSGWLVAGLLLVLLIGGTVWVWRPNPQGTYPLKLTRLTSDSGLTTDGVISPDGTLVAYASDRGGEENLDIWVKQVAGGEPIRLTRNSADDHFPDFSPDGSQIVFRSEQEGGGIYLVSTLGGEERLLAPLGRNPRFSPDGHWIAYWTGYHSVGLLGAQAGTDLFVIASTGGVPQGVLKGFAAPGCPVGHPTAAGCCSLATSKDREFSIKPTRTGGWFRGKEGSRSRPARLTCWRSNKLSERFHQAIGLGIASCSTLRWETA